MILALDTTARHCASALFDPATSTLLAARSDAIGRGHAEHLAPQVEALLDEAGVAPTAITRLAVCRGPGSFTGLRVALAWAVGFALPRSLPVLGVDALEVEAHRLRAQEGDALTVLFRDARRGEVMWAAYQDGAPLELPQTGTLEDAEAAAQRLQAGLHEVEAVSIAHLAQMAATLDPARYPPLPLYARGADAKLPGGKSPGGKPVDGKGRAGTPP